MVLFALVFLLAGNLWAAENPATSVKERYRKAVVSYGSGDFSLALSLFAAVRLERGHYKQTSSYIENCLAALRRGKDIEARRLTVERAQSILSARQAVLAGVREKVPGGAVLETETPFRLTLDPDIFFESGEVSMRDESELLMGLLRDYLATYRNPSVLLTYQLTDLSSIESELNMRRAVTLGLFFFRQFGVVWKNISVLSQPGPFNRLTIQVQSLPPSVPPGAQKVRGIVVRPRNRLFDLDAGTPLFIDVALMDPQLIREWSLRIWSEREDVVVREFSGPPEVFVTLGWDGRKSNGENVMPGEYQLLLSALNYAGERITDSDGFLVKTAFSRGARVYSPSRPLTPRQWVSMIRFKFNHGELGGLNNMDIKRVARNLQAFPGSKVCVDGYADKRETAALTLARKRADNVAGILQRSYGISPERIQAKGMVPRQAMEGESLQKVIVYFSR